MKRTTLLIILMSFLLAGVACQPQVETTEPVNELKVLTHDSFAVSENVITQFESENNVKVTFIQAGDTGSSLNRVILTKDSPLADVFYGVDNTYLTRALDADIFEPYKSELLADVEPSFTDNEDYLVTPVDYGDVCINYDKTYFAENDLAVPESFEDLLEPEYEGLLVVENPATSSPGLAFMLATISYFGPDKYLQYWGELKSNGLVVVNDWETAYYTNFSASSGQGLQPMVVSYGSSPPVEVVYAEEELDDSPTASITADYMCFRQVEYVGILQGTENRDLAEKFVDFLLSVPFQEDMPLQMFVFPVNTQAQLPEVFVKYAQIPEHPALLDSDDIAVNRDKWIQDWTDVVLK